MTVKAKKMSFDDACAILGITGDTSKEDAQKIYRKLAAMHHPDKVGDAGTEFMQQLNVAWSVLEDALKSEEDIRREAKARAEKQASDNKKKQSRARARVQKECILGDDGQSVMLSGQFQAHELIEVLYMIGKEHMESLGDVVKSTGMMVDFFRALSTGRTQKVFSLALLDSKNRLIRMEELTDESPSVKTVATQCLLHGAEGVYLVVNSPSGDVPKSLNPSQKNKLDELEAGLKLLGISLKDYLIIGQDEHFSVRDAMAIPRG